MFSSGNVTHSLTIAIQESHRRFHVGLSEYFKATKQTPHFSPRVVPEFKYRVFTYEKTVLSLLLPEFALYPLFITPPWRAHTYLILYYAAPKTSP